MGIKHSLPGIKVVELEAHHLTPSSTEVKKFPFSKSWCDAWESKQQ
jgi:hypothetical protein